MTSGNRWIIGRRLSRTTTPLESPLESPLGGPEMQRGLATRNAFAAKPGFLLVILGAIGLACLSTGCKDGPMYALKHANPYFPMRQWASDEKIGVTDHERRGELQSLADTMPGLSVERQEFWTGHLQKIYEHDESPEMRRLAVLAAGKSSDPVVMSVIEKGLEDDVIKVRMEACRALGSRPDEAATSLLAATVGSSQNQDVRHAAIQALAQHTGKIASDSLKLALQDRDPATQSLVIGSLRQSTGKDYGSDPESWIAALEGKDVEEQPRGGLRSYF